MDLEDMNAKETPEVESIKGISGVLVISSSQVDCLHQQINNNQQFFNSFFFRAQDFWNFSGGEIITMYF